MSGQLYSTIKLLRRVVPIAGRRLVSTSKKNNVTAEVIESTKTKSKTVASDQNWISYGYDCTSKEADRNAMHSIFFVSVTLCLVVGGFFWSYIPDYTLRDWSQREAYLELRRREEQGLPLIDPNFIDVNKITLPSDEELEGVEIII
ncbi:NADH dehydrogenase [ubiquinone] 1 beta subcomplex subunit 11, mitochondrial [Diorhabda carinulata]|uniref:NADH dehydrogenase [ubiquinone] 1 beta subcomplex subunit 11, mitochondrial n=1 Tax=Diorhabda sublineata TaxID=1163346 RepID=UPI0024E16F9E|nr:NADH dehydrogenase [ubiquinone] 1 beta subcomplex subunit 11, mitochondrial [Diorhabda sublineata]XP_057656423.1 NADH dehydrogenase [ubiquinone] 1 beta subcomplex subunit 11, mitochondrial [Diorhabda carinulata]